MYLAALGVRAMPSARERRAVRRARVVLATCVLPISAVCQCYWPPRWRASANRCLLLLGTGQTHQISRNCRKLVDCASVPCQTTIHPTRGSLAPDDLPQPFQPGGDVAFGAVAGGFVVVPAHEVVRRVLLGGHGVGRVVRVFVALAVAQLLGPGIVGVAQVRGDAVAEAGADVGDRLVYSHVRGVGLG